MYIAAGAGRFSLVVDDQRLGPNAPGHEAEQGRRVELPQRLALNAASPLGRDPQHGADFSQRGSFLVPHQQNGPFPVRKEKESLPNILFQILRAFRVLLRLDVERVAVKIVGPGIRLHLKVPDVEEVVLVQKAIGKIIVPPLALYTAVGLRRVGTAPASFIHSLTQNTHLPLHT